MPALESLRQVFHGPDSPPNVVMLPYGDLGLLPDRPSQAKLQELRNAVQNWLTSGPGAPPRALSLEDAPTPIEPRVFMRGNPNNLGEPVPRRFLAMLAGPERKPFRDGSGRLDLARAIASRDNPLTARALVNRVWMHHLRHAPGRDSGRLSACGASRRPTPSFSTIWPRASWTKAGRSRCSIAGSCFPVPISSKATIVPRLARSTLKIHSTGGRIAAGSISRRLATPFLAVSGQLDGRIGGPPMPEPDGTASNRRTLYGFIDRLNLPGCTARSTFPTRRRPAPAAIRRPSHPRRSFS